jgi:hypothetical protein
MARSKGTKLSDLFGNGSGQRCDIVVKDSGRTEYWIEVKAFPTNYCGRIFPQKGSPITDFIDECRRELWKRRRFPGRRLRFGGCGHVP